MRFIVEGRPAGQGGLDITRFLNPIKAAGREPNAILELWVPPEQTVNRKITKEQEWAEATVR
jgi:hypothetical protein